MAFKCGAEPEVGDRFLADDTAHGRGGQYGTVLLVRPEFHPEVEIARFMDHEEGIFAQYDDGSAPEWERMTRCTKVD